MTTPVDPPELPDEELDALASLLGSAAASMVAVLFS